jgi:hypothetical protein
MLHFLFQGVELAFDGQINLGHVAAAFDHLTPQSFAFSLFQPLLEHLCEHPAALARCHCVFKISENLLGQAVGAFDQCHSIPSTTILTYHTRKAASTPGRIPQFAHQINHTQPI